MLSLAYSIPLVIILACLYYILKYNSSNAEYVGLGMQKSGNKILYLVLIGSMIAEIIIFIKYS